MLEVAKFKAYNNSNVHNDSVLNVSENALITKLLMTSKTPQYRFFFYFPKKP